MKTAARGSSVDAPAEVPRAFTSLAEMPLFLNIQEVVVLLRIGRSTVYEAIRRGEIPSVRVGRRLLVPRDELLRSVGLRNPKDGA